MDKNTSNMRGVYHLWLEKIGDAYKDLDICLFYDDNPSVRVCDSYKYGKDEILKILTELHANEYYKHFCKETGYSRTFRSQYREWKAHNLLYKFGIFPERTGSVDIDQNEPKWRRFVYAILSIF